MTTATATQTIDWLGLSGRKYRYYTYPIGTTFNAAPGRGNALKRLEDELDAVTCALAAYLIWRRPSRWEMLGDLDGYIVAPRE